MPWKGVIVSEQRQRFIEDYQLNYYSIRDLAARFCISQKIVHMWIKRFKRNGVHERIHRTLKQEATIPPGSSLRA